MEEKIAMEQNQWHNIDGVHYRVAHVKSYVVCYGTELHDKSHYVVISDTLKGKYKC